jgi:2-C-methyl-D-erythritol 2,4-cyclodiphosphate synthase
LASPIRVGIGFDIHRLADLSADPSAVARGAKAEAQGAKAEGRRLVLAGVLVPHPLGPKAHSDGDVVLHAIADACLGAAGLGDLGDHFPDTDPAWKDADSARILALALAKVKAAGWRPASTDVNLLLERPKLGGLKEKMRGRLADLLGLAPDAVGLKARTLEGLGPIGAGQAVAAQAVVVLESI